MRYEQDGKCDVILPGGDYRRCGEKAVQEHVPTELQYCRRHHLAHRPHVEDDWKPIFSSAEGQS